jgi:phospholipase C
MRIHAWLSVAIACLGGASIVGLLSQASCSDSGDAAVDAGDEPDVDQRPPTPAAWDAPVTRPDDATATANRAACTYQRGAMPAATLGTSTPVDQDIPIDTVVVFMLENHSFDNYFGQLGKFLNRTDIESPPANASNPSAPDADGGVTQVPYVHAPHTCVFDPDHSWSGTHKEWDNGAMDGFVVANDENPADLPTGDDPSLASGDRSMVYYDQTDLPFYYAIAQSFATADHYHAPVLGPTWPNRMYLYAATSFGLTFNTFPDISAYPFPDNDASILDELVKRHVDWWIYRESVAAAEMIYNIGVVNRWGPAPLKTLDDFFNDAAAGTLPPMSFIDPNFAQEGSTGDDEHPPGDVQVGQALSAKITKALFASPQWAHTALFITWDEHGGFYDHVAPPSACIPDDTAPILDTGDTTPGTFDHEGMRVPLLVISPYAKKGYVGHTTYDHTSITRFIEAKFKIPALTRRDANADPLMDLFDFSAPQNLVPEAIADPVVDPTEQAYCVATYPPAQ